VFPWYAAVLLPFVPLLLRTAPRPALGVWCFTALIPLAYLAYASPSLYWLYPGVNIAAVALTISGAVMDVRLLRVVAPVIPRPLRVALAKKGKPL
jgi:hypothetical protein